MKISLLAAALLGLFLSLTARLYAQSITFTNDTVINSFDTNYDGAEIVVSNCTLTVDGPHAFSNLLVAAGGTLTHTFSSSGTVSVSRSFTDEAQILNDTNAVSLLNTGTLVTADVTDTGKTVTYTNDLDYVFTSPGSGLIQLQRTTNSTIPDGATVLVSYTVSVSTAAGLNLSVTGDVQVAGGGAINVNGRGYGGNVGPGQGGETFSSPYSGGGAGYGGYGGNSSSNAPGGIANGSFSSPSNLGSGGGYGAAGPSAVGGAGGGLVRIVAGGTLLIDGVISANGADATNSRSGGGSGGSIWLTAQSISGAGLMRANGGAGEPIHGGGGGGGRIALQADTNNFTGLTTAYGGAGAHIGGAGTIYTKLTAQNGNLLVDNGGLAGTNTLLQVSNGADLTVRGHAVGTTSGAQNVGKLLVASNSLITALSSSPTVTITSSDATIESGGRIAVDGLGPQFGIGSGSGYQTGAGIYQCGGGGHGGCGGMGGNSNARGGGAFESTAGPTSPGGAGAGSGSSFSPFGGLGGGAIRMTVNGKLIVNGSISADGKPGSGSYAGGGAGGSVWLTLGTWSGSGIVSANGAPGVLPGGGGGGGGRISISFNTNSFAGPVTAYGGYGTNAGGAGTIYLKTNSLGFAQLILDNGGLLGTNTVFDPFPVMDVTITGKANILAPSSWSVHNLLIRSNGIVTAAIVTSPVTVTFTATGDATIDSGGIFTMDGLGYGPAQGNGPGALKGGGGHGGFGGANPGTGNFGAAYDMITLPLNAGSGGGSSSGTVGPPLGGYGGGVLIFNVTGALTVNGRLTANGKDGDSNSGGGAGGSLNITCGPLLGSGIVSAKGGAGNGNAGGGGGGRIAISCSSNGFTGLLTSAGGNGFVAGGAGTIYTRLKTASVGDLLIDNGGLIGTNTPLSSSFLISSPPFNLTIGGGASVVPLTPLPLLSNLTVGANSALTTLAGQTSLAITATKNVNITSGGALSVDGRGFAQAAGPGMGHSLSGKGSGGGYGAIGGASASGAIGGTNYGSATQPVDRGSGGGAGANTFFGGSDGGGAIRLIVGGTLNVDGGLSANGNPGLQDDSGGGAGGSIWVTADTLSGSGFVSANGGAGELFGGGGGAGGRIAIYSRSNTFTGAISVAGGIGATAGGDGSLMLSANLPSIQGKVTDTNGLPVAGVVLLASLGNVSTTTAADGTYQLSLVPYTSFVVTPSFNGFVFVPAVRGYATTLTSVTNENYLMIDTIAPTITTGLQNTNLVIGWFGVAGVTYRVYSSTNLVDWLPYGSSVPGIGAPLEVLVPVDTDPQKFFRVRASN
jgi:hypothetical protein